MSRFAVVIPFPRYRLQRVRSRGVLGAWFDVDADQRVESALYAACFGCVATMIALCVVALSL